MRRWLCALLAAALLCSLIPSVGCAADEPPRDTYVIEAAYEEGVLTASMLCTFHNRTREELAHVDFNLYGNAYRADAQYKPVSAAYAARAYYNGESEGGMDILSVQPCGGWEVCGEDENILRVHLAEPLAPGEEVSLTVGYRLRLAEVEHRTGVARSAVNLGNFYPVLCVYEPGAGFYECVYSAVGDPFYSACADYEVTLSMPASFTAAASGEPRLGGGGKRRAPLHLPPRKRARLRPRARHFLHRTAGGGGGGVAALLLL